MSINKMTKEELELLSNKEITYLILEESKNPKTTADLFKKIIKLLELPESDFEAKIGDYYMALSTDKNVVMLPNGKWDLRNRHTSDKIIKVEDEDDEEDDSDSDGLEKDLEETDGTLEDSYEDTDDTDYDDADDDLKDLVVIDEDEMEIE